MKAPLMRFLAASTATSLGDDEVDVTISTDQLARDGNIWIPSGCDLTDYRRNPVVLWQHRPDQPIGTASNLRVVGGSVVGRIKFAPLGVSATADTARGLMKSGVLCGISAGIEAVDVVPIDPAKPRGGQRSADGTSRGLGDVSNRHGVGGAGIPRVTVSSDSFPATQAVSGTVNTKNALTGNSPAVGSVGVASASLLAANASRKGCVITNTSVNNISLGFGAAAVLGSGITLPPWGVFQMDEYMFSVAQIFAIASAAASSVAVQDWQ